MRAKEPKSLSCKPKNQYNANIDSLKKTTNTGIKELRICIV